MFRIVCPIKDSLIIFEHNKYGLEDYLNYKILYNVYVTGQRGKMLEVR